MHIFSFFLHFISFYAFLKFLCNVKTDVGSWNTKAAFVHVSLKIVNNNNSKKNSSCHFRSFHFVCRRLSSQGFSNKHKNFCKLYIVFSSLYCYLLNEMLNSGTFTLTQNGDTYTGKLQEFSEKCFIS